MKRLARQIKWAVMSWAFPSFDCEWCVCSPEEASGCCFCQYHGAIAPNVGPGRFRSWMQGKLRPRA